MTEEDTYTPSEGWTKERKGTQADRDNGYDFIGQPTDWEEPDWI